MKEVKEAIANAVPYVTVLCAISTLIISIMILINTRLALETRKDAVDLGGRSEGGCC